MNYDYMDFIFNDNMCCEGINENNVDCINVRESERGAIIDQRVQMGIKEGVGVD